MYTLEGVKINKIKNDFVHEMNFLYNVAILLYRFLFITRRTTHSSIDYLYFGMSQYAFVSLPWSL